MPSFSIKVKDARQKVIHSVAVYAPTPEAAGELALQRVSHLIGTERAGLTVQPLGKIGEHKRIRRFHMAELDDQAKGEEVTAPEEVATVPETDATEEAAKPEVDEETASEV